MESAAVEEVQQVIGWVTQNIWILFVFGGMIAGTVGGAFKALSKENDKRHERRMERLRLKYGRVGPTPDPQPQAAPNPAETDQERLRRETTQALKAHNGELPFRRAPVHVSNSGILGIE